MLSIADLLTGGDQNKERCVYCNVPGSDTNRRTTQYCPLWERHTAVPQDFVPGKDTQQFPKARPPCVESWTLHMRDALWGIAVCLSPRTKPWGTAVCLSQREQYWVVRRLISESGTLHVLYYLLKCVFYQSNKIINWSCIGWVCEREFSSAVYFMG